MQDFLNNATRFLRYFITICLGVFFALFGWLAPLMQRPITAIALVGLLLSGVVFIGLTLRAMLGVGAV